MIKTRESNLKIKRKVIIFGENENDVNKSMAMVNNNADEIVAVWISAPPTSSPKTLHELHQRITFSPPEPLTTLILSLM